MAELLLHTGQFFVLLGLIVAFYALGANQSQVELVRYRYLPRQLDDIKGVDAAGLAALQRTLP